MLERYLVSECSCTFFIKVSGNSIDLFAMYGDISLKNITNNLPRVFVCIVKYHPFSTQILICTLFSAGYILNSRILLLTLLNIEHHAYFHAEALSKAKSNPNTSRISNNLFVCFGKIYIQALVTRKKTSFLFQGESQTAPD